MRKYRAKPEVKEKNRKYNYKSKMDEDSEDEEYIDEDESAE